MYRESQAISCVCAPTTNPLCTRKTISLLVSFSFFLSSSGEDVWHGETTCPRLPRCACPHARANAQSHVSSRRGHVRWQCDTGTRTETLPMIVHQSERRTNTENGQGHDSTVLIDFVACTLQRRILYGIACNASYLGPETERHLAIVQKRG